MSARHTPGPWTLDEKHYDCGAIFGRDGVYVADAAPTGVPEVNLANARLIAAAPDLLAALRGLLAPDAEDCQAEQGHDDGIPEPCVACAGCAARTAIARAEGR